jgi:signal transduction histidine kinase
VIEEMSLRARSSGVILAAEIAPELPLLWAEPDGLRTILVNLLDNAFQFTPAGGRVVVRGRQEEGKLLIQVSDTGAGIPAEDLPHVFERFYRADKARSRRTAGAGSGAGLGLAIVQGIVAEHGGAVSAESAVGRGTTMTVTLPVRAGHEVVKPQTQRSGHSHSYSSAR